MNKKVLVLFFVLIISPFSKLKAEEIRIALDSNWPPYSSREMKGGGSMTVAIQKIFESEGIRVTPEWFPWSRGLREVKNNNIECIGGAYYTEERTKEYLYSESFYSIKLVIVSHRNLKRQINQISDLHNLKIGLVNNYAYPKEIYQIKGSNFIYGTNSTSVAEMVGEERVDVTIESDAVIKHILQTALINLKNNINVLSESPVQTNSVHLMCNKDNPKSKRIIEIFNRALTKMKADGSLEDVIKKEEMRRKTKFFPSLKYN